MDTTHAKAIIERGLRKVAIFSLEVALSP